jgi:AmpD protein
MIGGNVLLSTGQVLDIDPQEGWLRQARRVPSPNCDERPEGGDITLMVVHGISLPPGEYGGGWIDDLFCNRLDPAAHPYFRDIAGLQVSSHLLIRRDGEIVQYVPFGKRAWHAGDSCFEGRSACNDFSIGIELEGQDTEAYTDRQYERLAQVMRTLVAAYPGLSMDRVAGHCDIAPGRKTDPGPAFNWSRLRACLAGDDDVA